MLQSRNFFKKNVQYATVVDETRYSHIYKYDEASYPSEQHTLVPRACLSVPQITTAKDDGSPQTPLQVLPNLSLVMLHSLLES
jgi:hypothetical protein